jgi:hypothetical protein
VEQQNAVRRRGRTALIVVTAVVLGALAKKKAEGAEVPAAA